MLNIAICDDDLELCVELEKMLLNINNKFDIDIFFTGEDLCRIMSIGDSYDLIFLDIQMDKFNGIYVGKYIREKLNNDFTQIVYISAKKNYAMELFEMHPLHFLIKPLDVETVNKVVNKAMVLLDKNDLFFKYKKSQNFFKKPLKEIIFFASDGRKIFIHCINDCDDFYSKIEDVLEQVGKRYIHIHKSYLINYDHVIKFQYDQVEMSNNVILPISQSKRSFVRAKVLELEGELT